MDIQELKEQIILDDKIEIILSELGCTNIKNHQKYYSCGNPDGDNPMAMLVYKDNLDIENHTRTVVSKYGGRPDLIDYINYINKDKYFTYNLKWICEICGYDYYGKIKKIESPTLDWLNDMKKISEQDEYDNCELKPIDKSILGYYISFGNVFWSEEGISTKTQSIFEIGYDLDYHCITIPIYDETNELVGVKGRFLNPVGAKYIYLEPCSKSQILYGLNKTMPHIKEKNCCIVVESEKLVLRLWEMGIKNVVSIGGHSISKAQAKKLTMLNVGEIVLCYDKDVGVDEDGFFDNNFWKSEIDKFLESENISIMFDDFGILGEKESPADKSKEEFCELYNRRIKGKNAQL